MAAAIIQDFAEGRVVHPGQRGRPGLRGLALAVLALVPFAGGCAPTVRATVRSPTSAEIDLLQQAIRPLVAELRDPARPEFSGKCPIGLVVIQSPSINAGVGLGRATKRCTAFSLVVTEGMLRRLPVPMLRAVLAHELAHVKLGHLAARKERGATAGVLRPFTAAFDRRQEAEADRVAVDLLRRLEPRQPDSCIALVYVLAVLAEPPSATAWLASHPSPDGRVEAVLAGCNGD